MRGRSLILAFHNVVPDGMEGKGDQSLHLPFSRFLRFLDLIQDSCAVVPLDQILEGVTSADRPTVAFTFDDAYRGAVELGLPELVRRNLPATLFVAPGLFGVGGFWWDEFAGPRELAPEIRKAALETHAGMHQRMHAAMRSERSARTLPEPYGCATDTQVRTVAASGSLTLASHSWSHPNLTRLEPGDLLRELATPLEWLESVRSPVLRILAYPYGLTSPPVVEAARRAGYSGALLIEGGWYTPTSDRWAIHRYNIPAGLSEDGLFLRLAGVISTGPRFDG
ncbi:MAG: polysaccharide deacetylase family protein [Gemmatimonadales bacterium]